MSEANSGGRSGVWVVVGKVAAVLSLVIAAFTVYGHLYPEKAVLEAKCQLFETPSRPITYEKERTAKDLMSSSGEGRSTVSGSANKSRDSLEDAMSAARAAAAAASAAAMADIYKPSLLVCEVSNKGKQEAKDVVLDLPFRPSVSQTGEATSTYPQKGVRAVSVGALRPNTKQTLHVWADNVWSYDSRDADKYSLSFAGGMGKVLLPTMSYGGAGGVAQFANLLFDSPAIPLGILLFLAIIIGFTRAEMKRASKPPSANAEGTQSVSTPLNGNEQANVPPESTRIQPPVSDRTWRD